MRRIVCSIAAAWFAVLACPPAHAQSPLAPDVAITWEVKNRFRLFRYEQDFQRHVAVNRGDGVLAAERRLARQTDGRGWARLTVNGLCLDGVGRLLGECERDGVKENYLAPANHRIGAVLAHAPAGANCAWSFSDSDEAPRTANAPCDEEVRLRVAYGRPTIATVDVTLPETGTQRMTAEIQVRDLFIAGLGDSVASGEGNPDSPISLSDEGFCFRRFLGTSRSEYFRPGRAGYKGNKSCETDVSGGTDRQWAAISAKWMSAACHHSLYSYQVRTALALAVENPHLSVTFVPLACTGAEIETGLFKPQPSRESVCGRGSCPSNMPAQLSRLNEIVTAARRQQRERALDVVLLTVGANDVNFSELVSDVILQGGAERALFARAGRIATIDQVQRLLRIQLPRDFARLRAALKPLVGGDLKKVVYVPYGNPALQGQGDPCDGGSAGFDIHPAFTVDAARLRPTAQFVSATFLPALKALASCEGGAICGDASDRMTVADAHQTAFASHGFCARSDSDPAFDNECFTTDCKSFHTSLVEGAAHPLTCSKRVRDFRPYASRARWIRTANDSYFVAMTYPRGLSTNLQPVDIHDATWGVLSAVYGGAIHPTAEGHAAMADAAVPAARALLGLTPAAGSEDVQPANEEPESGGEEPSMEEQPGGEEQK
jgi:hypothetical protein